MKISLNIQHWYMWWFLKHLPLASLMMTWLSSLCPFLLLCWHVVEFDRVKIIMITFSPDCNHCMVILQSSCSACLTVGRITGELCFCESQSFDICHTASLQSILSQEQQRLQWFPINTRSTVEFLQHPMTMLIYCSLWLIGHITQLH